MNKLFFASLISILLAVDSYGQDSTRFKPYKSILQTRPTFGLSLPLTKLLKGDVTDYLLAYDDQTYYWQIISATLFFHKHWGIECNFQSGSSNRISKRGDKFLQAMQSEYGKDYYVTPSTGASYNDLDMLGGNVGRGLLGVIYRFESRRFLIYPKISMGYTSFYKDWGKAYLKEKNSNNILEVSYSENGPENYFTTAAAVTFGYKLRKRLFLCADLMTSYYKTNVLFTKTTENLASGQSITEGSRYKKNIVNQSLGVGLIFVMNNGHR